MNNTTRSQARRSTGNGEGRNRASLQKGSFQCRRCHNHVLTDPLFSGVRNRNHCPYCLWSRHVDLYQAGDRLSACKAAMQPVGLTLKSTPKKYGAAAGELMLIHQCVECGGISINRLAADDDPEKILELITASTTTDDWLHATLAGSGIQPLLVSDARLVHRRLYGWNSYTKPFHDSMQFIKEPDLHPW